ncbi:MAG TPA: adenylate/guanylate cyclase domain-containing protein [Flavobacteriales bacterium]|nr:adenylate/guanylate cyclase domain-containing protein [Flavobacteriales bacterium]
MIPDRTEKGVKRRHPLSLRFTDNALERAFWEKHDRDSLLLLRVAWCLAAGLYILIGVVLLRTITHGQGLISVAYFGIAIPVILLAMAASFVQRLDRWRQPIVLLTLIMSSLIVNAPFFWSDPPQEWNYAANILMVCFTFGFVAVRFRYAVVNAALLLLLFELILFAPPGQDFTRILYANTFFLSALLVSATAGSLLERSHRLNFLQERDLIRARALAELHRAKSDELLLNILPAEVADELKEVGTAQARHFDAATVLFTDFKGFTAVSEKLAPNDLVRDLNECFSAFDRICETHRIEKIKTIGDAYMAAGGLPTPNTTHAADVIKAALEMRDFIAEGKTRKIAAGLPYFEIRIGIHSGPVIAGIVGVKKFQYDIWGDTGNTASRMESSGEVGQVNISEATYALVKDEPGLAFTPRGKVHAKGKGEMEMYFVART